MNPERLEKLVKEFSPLMKHLAYKVPFKRMGFTVEDVESMFLDKLIHVYLKYQDRSWEDLKGVTASSLKNYLTKLWAKEHIMVRLDDDHFEYITPVYEEPSSYRVVEDLFFNYLKKELTSQEFQIFMLINFPPLYITSRVNNLSSRLPSKLFLEFLEAPVNNQTIKRFNRIRRDLWDKVKRLGDKYKQLEGI